MPPTERTALTPATNKHRGRGQSLALAAWSAACFVAVSLLTASNALKRPLYWKWHHLDTGPDKLRFPEGFLWGVSTAAHQIEGDNDNNQWSKWENTERCVFTSTYTKYMRMLCV